MTLPEQAKESSEKLMVCEHCQSVFDPHQNRTTVRVLIFPDTATIHGQTFVEYYSAICPVCKTVGDLLDRSSSQ